MLIIAVASIIILTALVIKSSKKRKKISEARVIFNFENNNRMTGDPNRSDKIKNWDNHEINSSNYYNYIIIIITTIKISERMIV